MKREVWTCDVCERELPLVGVKGQTTREFKKTWHWPSFRPDTQREPGHICDECWGVMAATASYVRMKVLEGKTR